MLIDGRSSDHQRSIRFEFDSRSRKGTERDDEGRRWKCEARPAVPSHERDISRFTWHDGRQLRGTALLDEMLIIHDDACVISLAAKLAYAALGPRVISVFMGNDPFPNPVVFPRQHFREAVARSFRFYSGIYSVHLLDTIRIIWLLIVSLCHICRSILTNFIFIFSVLRGTDNANQTTRKWKLQVAQCWIRNVEQTRFHTLQVMRVYKKYITDFCPKIFDSTIFRLKYKHMW